MRMPGESLPRGYLAGVLPGHPAGARDGRRRRWADADRRVRNAKRVCSAGCTTPAIPPTCRTTRPATPAPRAS